jgi:hypothetical protein
MMPSPAGIVLIKNAADSQVDILHPSPEVTVNNFY